MQLRRFVSLITLVTCVAACSIDEPCSPGQKYQNTVCMALVDGGAGTGGAGGGAGSGGIGGNGMVGMFGDACADTPDCAAPTDYCARDPNQTMGICTRQGCDVEPTICPANWYCEKQYQTFGLPAFCYQ